jgi:hypothetical protein
MITAAYLLEQLKTSFEQRKNRDYFNLIIKPRLSMTTSSSTKDSESVLPPNNKRKIASCNESSSKKLKKDAGVSTERVQK